MEFESMIEIATGISTVCMIIAGLTIFGLGPKFTDPMKQIPQLKPLSKLSVHLWGMLATVGLIAIVINIIGFMIRFISS